MDDLHARLIRWFEESELARMDEIDLAQRDREYFDGSQWTRDELKLLKERGQPAIVINKVADKVQLLCGMERKARTDPKAFARTPAEEDRADAATQALRYIADDNDFSIVRSEVFSSMLIEGAGGADLGLEDDGQGRCNITITTIPWDRIWYDPHSRSYDFSDARYKGMVIWTDRDSLEEMYPDADDVIEIIVLQHRLLLQRPARNRVLDRQQPQTCASRAMRLVRAWDVVARDLHQERAAGQAAEVQVQGP